MIDKMVARAPQYFLIQMLCELVPVTWSCIDVEHEKGSDSYMSETDSRATEVCRPKVKPSKMLIVIAREESGCRPISMAREPRGDWVVDMCLVLTIYEGELGEIERISERCGPEI